MSPEPRSASEAGSGTVELEPLRNSGSLAVKVTPVGRSNEIGSVMSTLPGRKEPEVSTLSSTESV